jgi:hypothetical protein
VVAGAVAAAAAGDSSSVATCLHLPEDPAARIRAICGQ